MAPNDYIEKLLKEAQAHFWNKPLPSDLMPQFPHISGKQGRELTYANLYEYPGLQKALAFIADYTLSKWLLEQEAPVQELRLPHHKEFPIHEFHPQEPTPSVKREDRKDIYDWARDRDVAGVCLSGGGIRSATFNLGIIRLNATDAWVNA